MAYVEKSSPTHMDLMNSARLAHPPTQDETDFVGAASYGDFQTVVCIRGILLNRLPQAVALCEDGIAVTITSGGYSYTLLPEMPMVEKVIRDSVLNSTIPRGVVQTYTAYWDNLCVILPGTPYHGDGPTYLPYPFEFQEGVHISVHSVDNTREFGTALCTGCADETLLSYPRGSVQVLFRQYHCSDGELVYTKYCPRRHRAPSAPPTPPSEPPASEPSVADGDDLSGTPGMSQSGLKTPTPSAVDSSRRSPPRSPEGSVRASVTVSEGTQRSSLPPYPDEREEVNSGEVKEVEMVTSSRVGSEDLPSRTPSASLLPEEPQEEEPREEAAAEDEEEEKASQAPPTISEKAAKDAQSDAAIDESDAAEIQEKARRLEDEGAGAVERVEIHRQAVEAEDRVMESEQLAADEEQLLVDAYAKANAEFDGVYDEKEIAAQNRRDLALQRIQEAATRKEASSALMKMAEEDLGKLVSEAEAATVAARKAQKDAEEMERVAVGARDQAPEDDSTYEMLNQTADLYLEMAKKERACAVANRNLAANLIDGAEPEAAAAEADRLAREADQFASDFRQPVREPPEEVKEEPKPVEEPVEAPKSERKKKKGGEEGGGCLC